jgi:hypothetical protein
VRLVLVYVTDPKKSVNRTAFSGLAKLVKIGLDVECTLRLRVEGKGCQGVFGPRAQGLQSSAVGSSHSACSLN